jgi:hypothetical protein
MNHIKSFESNKSKKGNKYTVSIEYDDWLVRQILNVIKTKTNIEFTMTMFKECDSIKKSMDNFIKTLLLEDAPMRNIPEHLLEYDYYDDLKDHLIFWFLDDENMIDELSKKYPMVLIQYYNAGVLEDKYKEKYPEIFDSLELGII